MILGLIYIGLPLAMYLLLAVLPEGPLARRGVFGAGVALALIWMTKPLGFGPIFTGDANADSYTVLALLLLTGAAALGGFVQLWRRFLPENRPRWMYPALVGGLLLLAGIPTLNMLGV